MGAHLRPPTPQKGTTHINLPQLLPCPSTLHLNRSLPDAPFPPAVSPGSPASFSPSHGIRKLPISFIHILSYSLGFAGPCHL
jgi:hypothetical protein